MVDNQLRKKLQGFSLVEILICLALLGVLTAFTIPYLKTAATSNQTDKYNRIARDTAFMMVTAFEKMRLNTTPDYVNNGKSYWDLNLTELTPYFNYVAADTSSKVDSAPTGNTDAGPSAITCGSTYVGTTICYRLHNGAILWGNNVYHSGSGDNNGLSFYIDPDGSTYTDSSTGSGKSLKVWLLSNGKVYSSANLPGSITAYVVFSPYSYTASVDPDWFKGF
jgi:prepilin-type N-terminal cleavage/methylation domain-containing protein